MTEGIRWKRRRYESSIRVYNDLVYFIQARSEHIVIPSFTKRQKSRREKQVWKSWMLINMCMDHIHTDLSAVIGVPNTLCDWRIWWGFVTWESSALRLLKAEICSSEIVCSERHPQECGRTVEKFEWNSSNSATLVDWEIVTIARRSDTPAIRRTFSTAIFDLNCWWKSRK